MLVGISWPVYGCCAGAFLVLAYALIGFFYYRREARALFKKTDGEIPDLAGKAVPEPGMSNTSLEALDLGKAQQQGELPDLLEELKWCFDQAARDEVPQEELPSRLAPLLEPHAELMASPAGEAVRELMRAECRAQLGYELPEKKHTLLHSGGLAVLLVLVSLAAQAQDGNAGLQQATQMVRGYFDTACTLMYAIGAVVGVVGAIKVYQKWNASEPDTGKVAAAWFGSCIFLVVVATVIKSFFGI
ncbi:MAG TPA: DUF4134 domain-containing protein [Mucilaginibacter sp.]|nr:DUF4134 domain-containing protein [Mucilaginibacter sp.]